MEQLKQSMAISELSTLSGIPLSTIKFYIRKKLLPKPIKTGKTRATYNTKHLDRLTLIKKIQKEGNIPLDKIREIINIIDLGEEREKEENSGTTLNKKADIINSAILLFREKGFDTVTITDIVDAARIGRATFYKYFSGKKDLFIECVQKISYNEVMNLDIKRPEDEKDILIVFNKHAEALTRATPLWKDMIKMLRVAAINDPDEFAGKLEETMYLKIDLYKRRIKKAIQQGILREVNHDVLAIMLLGIQEYCSEYLPDHTDDEIQRKKLLADATDIIQYGILKK